LVGVRSDKKNNKDIMPVNIFTKCGKNSKGWTRIVDAQNTSSRQTYEDNIVPSNISGRPDKKLFSK